MTLLEQATRQTPSDYVPNSVLQCLHLSGIQPRAALRPDALQPPAMVSAPMAAISQQEQRAFLKNSTSQYSTQRMEQCLSQKPRRVDIKQQARDVPPKHTYSAGQGHQQKPYQLDKLNVPVRSIDGPRRSVIEKVTQSREAGKQMPLMYEKDAAYRQNHRLALKNLFQASEDVGQCQLRISRRPRAAGRSPVLGKPAEPFAGSGDSIDMFLVTKSLAVPEGQRVVSDLGGDVMDPAPFSYEDSKTSQPVKATQFTRQPNVWGVNPPLQPFQLSGTPPAGSDMCLDDRIGQFGGLIPTLYTMDNPPKQRLASARPQNRYHAQVISRDTRVTGAGFRRNVNGGSPLRQRPGAHSSSADHACRDQSGYHADQAGAAGQDGSGAETAVYLEQEGALLYERSAT